MQRAIAFVAAAKAHDDRDLAIAHYRAALDLVEGEPLANALSGYAWWETEGHGGRIAAVLVTAACSMAALATEAGLFELARWGLERARLVEPYSEALSRTAMEVAAAEGDADRLAPRVARVPAAGRRTRSWKLAVSAHRRALRGVEPPSPDRPGTTSAPASGLRLIRWREGGRVGWRPASHHGAGAEAATRSTSLG